MAEKARPRLPGSVHSAAEAQLYALGGEAALNGLGHLGVGGQGEDAPGHVGQQHLQPGGPAQLHHLDAHHGGPHHQHFFGGLLPRSAELDGILHRAYSKHPVQLCPRDGGTES